MMYHLCAGKTWIRAISRCAFLFILSLEATYSLKFLSGPQYNVSLPENAALGFEITEVNATDPRSGENGTTYSLEQNPDSGSFRIDEHSGQISVAKQLDREVTSRFNLTVTAVCCDDNTTSSALIEVIVLDVNDNDPKFSEKSATVTLTQNFNAGETVRLPTATDADAPPNDQIKYKAFIVPPWNEYFEVNETTGQLRTLKACDTSCSEKFENGKDHIVTLVVSAVGPVLVNRSSIMIIIQLKYNDTNIHSPTFQKDAYVVDVNVSTPVDGRVLLTVRAEDPDPDDNGKIEYSFAKDTNDRTKSIFGLHLNTGEITLSYALDGEEVIYRFTVVARDKGVVPKSGQTEVWVVVTGRTGNVNGSVISAVAGCLGGAVLILGVILVLCFTRLKKLRNQIQEEKLDKENMKRLFQLNQIHFQDSNQPNVRSEPFDMIDDGQIPNYNEIVDSPSGGGYNLPNDFPLPNDSDVAGESSTDIREGTGDYMHPIGTLPRSNRGLTSDGYMMAVSTSASSNATLKNDDMDYIHANSLKR